jgi:hypothetical protein
MYDGAMIAVVMTVDIAWNSCLHGNFLRDFYRRCFLKSSVPSGGFFKMFAVMIMWF